MPCNFESSQGGGLSPFKVVAIVARLINSSFHQEQLGVFNFTFSIYCCSTSPISAACLPIQPRLTARTRLHSKLGEYDGEVSIFTYLGDPKIANNSRDKAVLV